MPAPVKAGTVGAPVGSAAVTASVPRNDSYTDRDTLPKTYDYRPAVVDPDYGSRYGDSAGGSGVSPAAAAAAVGVGAAAAGGAALMAKSSSSRVATPEDLPLSRSMRVDSPNHFAAGPAMQGEGSNGALGASSGGALTPWEAGPSRGGRGSPAPPAAASPAHLTHLSSLAPVRTSVGGPASPGVMGAAAGVGALAAGAGASGLASGGSSGLQQHDSGAWRSNVRPTSSGSMTGSAAGGASSMAGAKSMQQAERAKFWAQFQETWQQV